MNRLPNSPERRNVVVLGSTGSIGVNALEVIAALPERLQVVGLSAHANAALLKEQIERYRPRWAAITDVPTLDAFPQRKLGDTQIFSGQDGIQKMVRDADVNVVLVAIVGAAGLFGTWAALEAGKTVTVANKETLVMAGPLVMDLAARTGATILPVDSEHSAIFQCLDRRAGGGSPPITNVQRVVLTASGGPFRGWSAKQLESVTVEQALNHPTWKMGAKITVDSATLMNKALEVIEARWLFGLKPEQIEVIIHPESIIHSFVEFTDGSVLAQLSPPDMRLPIQYALTYPDRLAGPARKLNWETLKSLNFEKPDMATFPALQLGYDVARRGGTCGAVLNAANEAAVGRFLAGTLRFVDIPRVCRDILDRHEYKTAPALGELLAVDRWAREEVVRWVNGSKTMQ